MEKKDEAMRRQAEQLGLALLKSGRLDAETVRDIVARPETAKEAAAALAEAAQKLAQKQARTGSGDQKPDNEFENNFFW